MVWVESTLRDQTLCHGQGCHPSDQVPPGPTQPGLSCCTNFPQALKYIYCVVTVIKGRTVKSTYSGSKLTFSAIFFSPLFLLQDLIVHVEE